MHGTRSPSRLNSSFQLHLIFHINPFIPKFLKWTLPSLNLDTFIVTNRGFSQKSIMANSVDPDEMARNNEPSHLDQHCLQRCLY